MTGYEVINFILPYMIVGIAVLLIWIRRPHFHKWSNWIGSDTDSQWRYCKVCKKKEVNLL